MPRQFILIPEIKIGGAQLAAEKVNAVLEVVVDSSTHMPSMCTITFHDPDLELVDSADFDIGKPLDVSFGAFSGPNLPPPTQGTQVFSGEITALEPSFDSAGLSRFQVRAYDKSHRLHRGKKTRTFLQKKDSDLASTIAGEAGLSAVVDATTVTHEYALQNNQTNMEFLQALAHRIGYQVYSTLGKLYFKKSSSNLGTGPELVFGEDLQAFRPRATAVQQHEKSTAMGWDPGTKAAITSTVAAATFPNQGGIPSSGGAKAQSAFGGSAEAVITDVPVATVDDAKAVAQGLEDRINSEFIQAEGVCEGNPQVMPLYNVKVTKVGTKFSGTYLVTEATHHWTSDGYETRFVVSGHRSNTMAALVQSSGGGDGRARGVVVGVVTNLNDPDDCGRVKVKFPWLPKNQGAEIESTWCRFAAPMAGAQRGMYFLPEVNDEVLVAFEHDDMNYPYIIGGLWGKKDKPPIAIGDAVASGKVKQRVIKSTSGHIIILDDSQGAEKITIRDKTAKNEIVIDSASNTMTVTVEKDLTITAKGAVAIKTSSGDMSLEANNVNVKAKQNVKVEATSSLNLKATSSCTVEGTAGVTIKNAAAEIAMSGPTINMNKGALEVM